MVAGTKATRLEARKADYLLRYTPDFAIAVVEAKAEHKLPADGLQQSKEYAQTLGLKFAYATNGKGIIEFDFLTGKESEIEGFPTADELWGRLKQSECLTDDQTERLLTPFNTYAGKPPRYYQEIAINTAVKAILNPRLGQWQQWSFRTFGLVTVERGDLTSHHNLAFRSGE